MEKTQFSTEGFNENEISVNSQGGTELVKRRIASGLPQDLVSNFQIICSRVRELDPEKIRVLWMHDLPVDARALSEANFRNKFHKFVFVSNWQYEQFRNQLGVPYDSKSTVINHGVEAFPFSPEKKRKDGKINLVYASTPHRGLSLLIPVFKALREKHPDVHLHVFSSFGIYGWQERDKEFESLFEECRANPDITYHGWVSNEELREQLSHMDVLAYPSTWPETSCLTLIESMSAGLACVHSSLGALPETSGGLTFQYQFDQDPERHARSFYQALDAGVNAARDGTEEFYQYLRMVKISADFRFSLNRATDNWKNFLENLAQEFPSEKRGFAREMFTYSPG